MAIPSSTEAAGRRPLARRFREATQSLRLGRGLTAALSLAVLAAGIATYVVLTRGDALGGTAPRMVIGLLVVDLVLVLVVGVLVALRIVRVWIERRSGAAGSRLHVRPRRHVFAGGGHPGHCRGRSVGPADPVRHRGMVQRPSQHGDSGIIGGRQCLSSGTSAGHRRRRHGDGQRPEPRRFGADAVAGAPRATGIDPGGDPRLERGRDLRFFGSGIGPCRARLFAGGLHPANPALGL